MKKSVSQTQVTKSVSRDSKTLIRREELITRLLGKSSLQGKCCGNSCGHIV